MENESVIYVLPPAACILGVRSAIAFHRITVDIPPVSIDMAPGRNFKTHTDKDVIHNVLPFMGAPQRIYVFPIVVFLFFFVRPRKDKAYLLESYKTIMPKWKKEGQIS